LRPDYTTIERIYAIIIEVHFIKEKKISAAAIGTAKKFFPATRDILRNSKAKMS
jgi:hypothetical protein